MSTRDTGPVSPLEGLFRCATCMQQLHLSQSPSGGSLRYTCQANEPATHSTCPAKPLGHQVDQTILRGILLAVLTEQNMALALAAARQHQTEEDGIAQRITRNQLEGFKDDPAQFVRALGGPDISSGFLSKFITEVQLDEDRATVLYRIPLPQDSHLAGLQQQVIPFEREEPDG